MVAATKTLYKRKETELFEYYLEYFTCELDVGTEINQRKHHIKEQSLYTIYKNNIGVHKLHFWSTQDDNCSNIAISKLTL